MRREKDNVTLIRMQLENEIVKLKTDNETLLSQLKIMAASARVGSA